MNKEELLVYEMPAIAEFVSIGWMQTIIAKYVAWKVNRKVERYNYRARRKALLLALKKQV